MYTYESTLGVMIAISSGLLRDMKAYIITD